MYAQTLVYGLFVARYFDPTIKDFSRYEAQDLLPSTNPLLKKFFGHVADTFYFRGYSVDKPWLLEHSNTSFDGLAWDVDSVVAKKYSFFEGNRFDHGYVRFTF